MLQKDSFISSCMSRGEPLIDVIRPKFWLPVEALPFAFPGLMMLNALKNSPRTCSVIRDRAHSRPYQDQ